MTQEAVPPDPDLTRTSTSIPAILTAGTLLAERYEICELVGVGGMGMLYRARDTRLDIDVALKALRPELVGDGGILARFERELLLGRQVSHRNVVRIHDIGQDGDVHFLTMDFVRGESLRQVLTEAGAALPVERCVEIAIDLAEAMAAAHASDVIHRDLKPGNVLIDESGTAYVTDFGVARSVTGASLTRTGQVIGTPDYLSPEQAMGGTVDARSDVYALGLLLYEMLSGELPSQGESLQEIITQRAVGHTRDIVTTGATVPAWLRLVLNRCLEKDPDARYQDAGEMASDLRAATAPPRRAYSWWQSAAAVLALLITAGIAVLLWLDRSAVPTDGTTSVITEPGRYAVAILPIIDETGRADLAWIPTGVAELLASRLADSPAIDVIESRRVFQTMQDLRLTSSGLSTSDIRRLGELFGAGRLLTGTVRSVAGQLRVDARLLDVAAPSAPAITFAAQSADEAQIFALVNQLSDEVRASFELPPDAPGPQRLPASAEALRAYSAGVDALLRGDSVAAAPELEQAVAEAPDFTEGWIRLAETYAALGYHDRSLTAIRRAVSGAGPGQSRLALEARAREAALEGDFEQARSLFETLMRDYGGETDVHVGFAESYGDEGHFAEASAILKTVVASDPNHPRAWYLLAKYAILSGDISRAVDDYLVRALVIQNKLGNDKGKADVLNATGLAQLRLGELAGAERNFSEALILRRTVGDTRGEAATLGNLANIAMFDGDFPRARAMLNEAILIRERMGDESGRAHLLNVLGVLEEELGNYREALDHYRNGLQIREQQGDRLALAESYNNVGFAYLMLGEYDNAAVYWQRALEEARTIGNPDSEMVATQNIGLLELARGHWDAAIRAYLESLETSRSLGYTDAEAVSLGHIGRVAHFQGRYGAALESYAEALNIVEELDDPRGRIEFTLFRSMTQIEIGNNEQAASDLDQIAGFLAATPNFDQQAHLSGLRGELALRAGDYDAATAHFQQARGNSGSNTVASIRSRLDLARVQMAGGKADSTELRRIVQAAERIGNAVLTMSVMYALAQAQFSDGDLDGAKPTIDRLLALLDKHSPLGHAFQYQHLAADIFAATGANDEAVAMLLKARKELQRIDALVPPAARTSFRNTPAVRRLNDVIETP